METLGLWGWITTLTWWGPIDTAIEHFDRSMRKALKTQIGCFIAKLLKNDQRDTAHAVCQAFPAAVHSLSEIQILLVIRFAEQLHKKGINPAPALDHGIANIAAA